MKKMLLEILLLIIPVICDSQNQDSLIIRNDSISYNIDYNKKVYVLEYVIFNNSYDIYYIWIEKTIHSSIIEKIKDYFMKNKGDMSVYQMATETNVIYGNSCLYSTFLKKVNQKETFRIQVITSKEISDFDKNQIYKYLKDHTVIINESTLSQYIRGLSSFNPLLFYNKDYLIIPFDMIEYEF